MAQNDANAPFLVSLWKSGVYRQRDERSIFYQSAAWNRLRRTVLRRDGYRCRRCQSPSITGSALTTHHIRADGADDPANLITLCAPCHDFVEMRPILKTRGLIIASGTPRSRSPTGRRVSASRHAGNKRPATKPKKCPYCGGVMPKPRRNQIYCRVSCRVLAWRKRSFIRI